MRTLYYVPFIPPIGQVFTPVLAAFYDEVNSDEKQFEVVYCSDDNTQQEFKEYTEMMPWKAIPYKDPIVAKAAGEFKVSGIPRLIILKPDGKKIVDDARADVQTQGPEALKKWLKL